MASQKMNSKTHKVITACWVSDDRQHFVVPIDWEIEDIEFDFGLLSYKGEEKPYIPDKFVEGKCKYPVSIEEADWEDVAGYFSCCESDEEEEEEEEIYYCCDCGVELDRVRDGEEKPDFRCNNCYWEDKEGIDSKNIITPDYRKQEEEEEEDLCEKCEDINCCTKDELICCMCCELLKCDMFSQNCGKCLKPMCMDCDNDERKFNGENVCEKCEEEEEEEK